MKSLSKNGYFKALVFATAKHQGQKRKGSKIDYISHPIRVAFLVSTVLGKYDKYSDILDLMIQVALLHDTLEDTQTTREELRKEFGTQVESLVYELTNDAQKVKSLGKSEYLKPKLMALSKLALIVKLLDRYANITDSPTVKYLIDTVGLMDYIKSNRTDLDKTDIMILDLISFESNYLINEKCSQALSKMDH